MAQTLKIFVVDDEEDYLIVIEKMLLNSNFEVRTFNSGIDLFECMEKEIPDVIITDLMMPVMSGHSLGYMLKSNFPQIKVVILSSIDPSLEENRKDFWPDGTVFFEKPVNFAELIEHLKQLDSPNS